MASHPAPAPVAAAAQAPTGPAATSTSLSRFQTLLKTWEESRNATANGAPPGPNPSFDPTQLLCDMAEILEKETDVFLSRDPDPFEERHPSRVDPECQLGLCLKAFFKKESLVNDVLNHYLRDNYWTRQGQTRDAFDLNVATCRIILDILPGLEIAVLNETEGLLKRLYSWAESGKEPLQSYATGLLGVAMELNEVATDPENRELNNKLVPVLINRLRTLKTEAREQSEKSKESFKRPFAVFSSAKSPKRRISTDSHEDVSAATSLGSPLHGAHAPFSPPSHGGSELSNSSWAEMEPQIIGHFPIYPLSLQAKQVFILRLLTPLAEYQEFLTFIHDYGVTDLLTHFINVKETRDARLAFEALKFLAALFCHKKFVLEWVSMSGAGLNVLLDVPRPSIASTAVAQCLYFIACADDVMERVCLMNEDTLLRLVKYILWCMECSHESGRTFAVLFFGHATSFRTLLTLFDREGGIRRLFNTISTLKMLNLNNVPSGSDGNGGSAAGEGGATPSSFLRHLLNAAGANMDGGDDLLLTEDEEVVQKQALRHAMVAFKKYFEAHLGIKLEEMKRMLGRDSSASPPYPNQAHKAIRYSPQQVADQVETLMELLSFRARWTPVDEFLRLGGINICLQVVAMAYDWTFPGRAEMVRSALDVLAICAVMPRVQLSLCERIELNDRSTTAGINIILGAAEGEIVQESADVRRSALNVLINCVCAPIARPGAAVASFCGGLAVTPVASGKKRVSLSGKGSEELINKVWNCVRSNNGIMTLLEMLHIKAPITDADSIRALACRALVGLARSPAAKQIMSKLPIFSNGQLQQLVREPILQDKRAEHVKFQQFAHELMQTAGSPAEGASRAISNSSDFSLEVLHRASVVAQTKISFSKKQLLQLIQEYLGSQGLSESAAVLQREANLAIMNSTARSLMHRALSCTTPSAASALSASPAVPSGLLSPAVNRTQPRLQHLSPTGPSSQTSRPVSPPLSLTDPSVLASSSTATPSLPSASSIPIRVNRSARTNKQDTPTVISAASGSLATPTATRSLQKALDTKLTSEIIELPLEDTNRVTLVSIVCDYLSSQHSLCKNPMTTCPEFDLLQPHKCPDPRPRHSAPFNFTTRHLRRSTHFPPYGGPDGAKLDRKLIYGRFRPAKVFRFEEGEDSAENSFTSCAIMPDDGFLMAGTYLGDVKMFNLATGDLESTYHCHESNVYHIQPSRDGKLLLTSSAWRSPFSNLWSMGTFFDGVLEFRDEEYVEFSKLTQDKVIGTKSEVATIYDIATKQKIRELKSQSSNIYQRNRATFDPTDELVLNDGVLYDMRSSVEVRKLDKLNATLSGVFHPNGLEIISSSQVWDIRTFQLLKTVTGLDQCLPIFSNSGEIIYAVSLDNEDDDGDNKYESAFKVLDASDYSSIATFETRRGILGLSSSRTDLQLAVVENSLSQMVHEESVVRLYDVGRLRADEEEEDDDNAMDDEEEEEGRDPGDDESDGSLDFEDILQQTSDDEDFEDEEFEDESENSSGNNDDDTMNDDDDIESSSEEGSQENNSNSNDSWEDMEREEVIG